LKAAVKTTASKKSALKVDDKKDKKNELSNAKAALKASAAPQ